MEIWAANGIKIDVLRKARAYFTVDGLDMTAYVLVSNGLHEHMLGYDWLVAQDALWDFINKTFLIKDNIITLRMRQSRPNICRIYVRECIITMIEMSLHLDLTACKVVLLDFIDPSRSSVDGMTATANES